MPIIIIEGGELAGKTSVVRALQEKIPYHTLIKMSGYPTSQVRNQFMRSELVSRQFQLVAPIITHFAKEDKMRTLIFDRFSTTEKVMFPLSFNHGRMLSSLQHAAACDVKQIILTAPIGILEHRFNERRKSNSLELQTLSTILSVHKDYIEESVTSPVETIVISNDGSKTPNNIADMIIQLFKIPIFNIED